MKYRAEIDGLRAIAVIPVILFHAGFEWFSGGFVGVDVFFVISGYLITTIILAEKEKGSFSLANFYERRARRILPALFLVMFACLPFAWFWLLPSDLKDFSQSLIAVVTFSSNILFWQETGYWGAENELKPLLHTWSLAVEEQYYVLFPLFLMLMWRFPKSWMITSFVLLVVCSLIAAQWSAYNDPTANFFLLTTRAWELGIGACIAFYFIYKKQTVRALLSHQSIDEILGVVGLILIGYSVFLFDETVPFPSVYALVPTIGTGLIIVFASQNTWVGRVLGMKIPVEIGLISYSAYLWHQPLFAFAHHRSIHEPSELLIMGLSLITFVLAYLSCKYVEKPFRKKDLFNRKAIFIFGLSGSIIFLSIGVAGHLTGGFNRVSDKNGMTQEAIEMQFKINHGLSNRCDELPSLSPDCKTGDQPEVLIWGDSYAMHLVPGVLSSNPNVKIIQLTKSVCGPFFDIAPVTKSYPAEWARGCLEYTNEVRKLIQASNTIKYVVLASHFNNYLTANNELLFRNGDIERANVNTVTREFQNTLEELKSMGVVPVVFSSPPANGEDLGRCLGKAEWMGERLDRCDFELSQMSEDRTGEYRFLEQFKGTTRVIRLDEMICDQAKCRSHFGSTWMYRDKGHLSIAGSVKLGREYGFYDMIIGD
ncbi:MAG: acyltransferase [Pseudomonadales bacterium]|nr:acyltransferase [Pseudomonadales bacterium]